MMTTEQRLLSALLAASLVLLALWPKPTPELTAICLSAAVFFALLALMGVR